MFRSLVFVLAVCASSSCFGADSVLFETGSQFQPVDMGGFTFKFSTSAGGFFSTPLGATGSSTVISAASSSEAQQLTADLIAGITPFLDINGQSAIAHDMPNLSGATINSYEVFVIDHQASPFFDVLVRGMGVVPEPATSMLLLPALLLLACRRR